MQRYLSPKSKATAAAVFANINTKQCQLNVEADIITVVECEEHEECNQTKALVSLAYISLILFQREHSLR